MTGALQVLLTVGPLSAYFLVQGLWQGGRRSKVVPGPVDFAWLAFGIGGLLIFGPIGHVLVATIFPAPSLWAWLSLPSAALLGVLLWMPRTTRRLVVYNVVPEILWRGLQKALEPQPEHFQRTVRGFEDVESGRGIAVEMGPGARTAVVEAYGTRPEELMERLDRGLRMALSDEPTTPRGTARVWLALASLLPLASVAWLLLERPQVQAALRALLGRFGGG